MSLTAEVVRTAVRAGTKKKKKTRRITAMTRKRRQAVEETKRKKERKRRSEEDSSRIQIIRGRERKRRPREKDGEALDEKEKEEKVRKRTAAEVEEVQRARGKLVLGIDFPQIRQRKASREGLKRKKTRSEGQQKKKKKSLKTDTKDSNDDDTDTTPHKSIAQNEGKERRRVFPPLHLLRRQRGVRSLYLSSHLHRSFYPSVSSIDLLFRSSSSSLLLVPSSSFRSRKKENSIAVVPLRALLPARESTGRLHPSSAFPSSFLLSSLSFQFSTCRSTDTRDHEGVGDQVAVYSAWLSVCLSVLSTDVALPLFIRPALSTRLASEFLPRCLLVTSDDPRHRQRADCASGREAWGFLSLLFLSMFFSKNHRAG